jgi:fructosamine-3-kinase
VTPEVRAAIERATGSTVASTRAVGGGSIASASEVTLTDGRRVFLKTDANAPAGAFAAEARSLRFIAEPKAVRVPDVIAFEASAGDGAFLLLEHIATGRPAKDHDERLGAGLAAMHRASPGRCGGPADVGCLAGIATDDRTSPDPARFYAERRLLPLFSAVEARGLATRSMREGIDRVCARIHELVPAEPPARLHGDLWGGNAMVDDRGAPCLVDPAAYGAHREIDLAMMQLFGGFSARVFGAYDEAWPRAPGHAGRVPLWQLLPLLVHTILFGGSYAAQVERALRSF